MFSRYNPTTRLMDKYDKSLNTLINPNVILSLYEDNENRIWIGSMCGLFVLMKNYETFNIYIYPIIKIFLIQKNIIIPICQAGETLWLGTQDG